MTIAALGAGDQVLILRKGGIGEGRFALPHPNFYLFPAFEHQRPELVRERARVRYAAILDQRTEPDVRQLEYWAEVTAAHPVDSPTVLAGLRDQHILSDDYAAERLKWRPRQPLWALVLRVWRLADPPLVATTPELGGCVSWLSLDRLPAPGERTPIVEDGPFAAAAERVESLLLDGATHR